MCVTYNSLEDVTEAEEQIASHDSTRYAMKIEPSVLLRREGPTQKLAPSNIAH